MTAHNTVYYWIPVSCVQRIIPVSSVSVSTSSLRITIIKYNKSFIKYYIRIPLNPFIMNAQNSTCWFHILLRIPHIRLENPHTKFALRTQNLLLRVNYNIIQTCISDPCCATACIHSYCCLPIHLFWNCLRGMFLIRLDSILFSTDGPMHYKRSEIRNNKQQQIYEKNG